MVAFNNILTVKQKFDIFISCQFGSKCVGINCNNNEMTSSFIGLATSVIEFDITKMAKDSLLSNSELRKSSKNMTLFSYNSYECTECIENEEQVTLRCLCYYWFFSGHSLKYAWTKAIFIYKNTSIYGHNHVIWHIKIKGVSAKNLLYFNRCLSFFHDYVFNAFNKFMPLTWLQYI